MAVAESPAYEEEEAYMEPVRNGGIGETIGGSAPRDQADKQMLVSKVSRLLTAAGPELDEALLVCSRTVFALY